MPDGCWVLCTVPPHGLGSNGKPGSLGEGSGASDVGRRAEPPRREDRPSGPRRGGEGGGTPRARSLPYTVPSGLVRADVLLERTGRDCGESGAELSRLVVRWVLQQA